MTRTRRRKIVRSKAIRRVKPNAKRKERKTQKRKSRNKVMKGGVHHSFHVYVIQKKLGDPKCIIVREQSLPKDTIYLFFHSKMNEEEIKEFVCAAMGLDVSAVITPKLQFTSDESDGQATSSNGQATSSKGKTTSYTSHKDQAYNLFVKLSTKITPTFTRKLRDNFSYFLSSGRLYNDNSTTRYITDSSDFPLQKHVVEPKIDMKNGAAIIESLKSKSTKKDYTFTEFIKRKSYDTYFDDEYINHQDPGLLFGKVIRDTNEEIKKLKNGS